MKRHFLIVLTVLLAVITSTGCAASYTLPEKMYNQLAIGSGLKGSFMITAEGEKFDTPFMNQITDAEFDIRGIVSGKDLHYYVFQQREDEQQTAVNELYRKDGVFYFRSDMVQGKILSFPTLSQIVETLFPAEGENTASSGFISRIITMPEEERKEHWDPLLNRYQKELEMWLADFTVQADSVKLENGFSALDFTYDIPLDQVNEQIIRLYAELTADNELSSLLDSIMTAEEKALYVNGNLLYFYQEALNSLNLSGSVRMSKRVSAMGELLRFSLSLPLDKRTTGYESLSIEMVDQLTVYTLRNSDRIISLALPDMEVFRQPTFNTSVWFAYIQNNTDQPMNTAFRADIQKNNETYNDENEKSHETDQYYIRLEPDTKYLPADADLSHLSESEPVTADIDLHYSSKYAQNSATTLEIKAEITDGESIMKIEGKVKTAAPWLFMPFEVIDPIQTGTSPEEVLEPYLTDWISNAESLITHIREEDVPDTVQQENNETEQPETQEKEPSQVSGEDQNAEAVPLNEDNHE